MNWNLIIALIVVFVIMCFYIGLKCTGCDWIFPSGNVPSQIGGDFIGDIDVSQVGGSIDAINKILFKTLYF